MDYSSPPSYDQATGITTSHSPQQRSYPKPPTGFIPADNYSNVPPPPVQQHPISTTNYPQQQGQPTQQPTRVIYIQSRVIQLGPREVYVTCPHCHIQKMSRIEAEPSSKTHLFAALLCILGFWCCACLPYCMESCMNVNHYCGNCNHFLGTYTDEGVVR